ncbi:glycosyltransferase family 2 protein [Spirilliplanes yamanashiensis]|uniref:Glycosyltransferase 2-like domain-containing protein n=1 Tax=Spirilliplanes yamanashiensis TaxID=42233 RepID=A0A8J3YCL1_9ACTN|nr:glycosyltransferase family 2 protein [Spirilliplanes yamanashiensis]MDP9818836.1 hypothetical protein [Spirilliplanes yamanashiensis]GIJ05290.1 hypothetical protein Sya03_46420 [Spirilliplanes yamanashiensis]
MSVVLPALNEENNLPLVLEGLPDLVDEVVVVDGGSVDDTVAIAREVRPDAVVVRQTRRGKGNALVCGFAAATGDIIVTLNADGSTDPGEIPRYVDALLAGAEVAHGSRYRAGGGSFEGSRWDDLGNRTLNTMVNALFGTRFTDLAFGYNAFWRSLLPALDLPEADGPAPRRGGAVWGDGPEIEPLINIRMAAQGLRVVEVASIGYPRIHGEVRRSRLREGGLALKAVAAEWQRHRRANRTVAGRHGASAAAAATAPAPAPARTDVTPPLQRAAAEPLPPWADILPGPAAPPAGPRPGPGGGGGRHAAPSDDEQDRFPRRQAPDRPTGRHGAPDASDTLDDHGSAFSAAGGLGSGGGEPAWRGGERRHGADRRRSATRRAPSTGAASWEANPRPELTVITGAGDSPMTTLTPGRRPTHLRAVAGDTRWS